MNKSKKTIRIFTSTGCNICKQSTAYLRKQGISFEEINMDDYPELSNIPVAPVICKLGKKGKKGKCVIGFQKKALDELIKKQKKK